MPRSNLVVPCTEPQEKSHIEIKLWLITVRYFSGTLKWPGTDDSLEDRQRESGRESVRIERLKERACLGNMLKQSLGCRKSVCECVCVVFSVRAYMSQEGCALGTLMCQARRHKQKI